MTNALARRLLVACPEHVLVSSLRDFADERIASGEPWSVALRAPVRLPSLDTDIVLCRETIAELSAPVYPSRESSLSVHWQPADGSSFPHFEGRVWCEADTACTSWLRLEGEYRTLEHRLRHVESGERTIGHRIALATAKAFLDELADSIKNLHAA